MFQLFNSHARFREIVLAAALLPFLGKLVVDQRFPRLIGLRESAGVSFARKRVVVVGVGSVGRRIALHLTRLGIDLLWLVDPDRYDDRANLLTQEILGPDLGQSKVGSTGKACKEISPATRVFAYEGRLQDLDPVTMAAADAVFLATDNLAVEVDACHQFRLLGIPIVQASVHGETLVAQVRLVENQRADGPCLICSFGPEDYRHLNQSSIFRCTGVDTGARPSEQINVMPTISTSFLCSLAADFALTQWTRHVLNLGQPVADTLLQYCGYTHRLTQAGLARNKNCKCGHMILERVGLPKPLAACTSGELAHCAGFEDQTLAGRSLTLGDLSYVELAVCRCEQHRVERFLPSGETLGTCRACAAPITPQPYYTSRPTPGSELNSQRDRPLQELGAEAAAWAVVQGGERGVLLRADTPIESTADNDQETNHD
jgi:molybdopterin/thiamine biosynthesis adenylyltransferase